MTQTLIAAVPPAPMAAEILAPRIAAAAQMTRPRPFRPRRRHRAVAAGFVALVLVPVLAAAIYLFGFAAPQFHSSTAFSVRTEQASAASGILGAIAPLGKAASGDAEILYDYIRSQAMAEAVDRDVNLRRIYAGSGSDPLYSLPADAPVEEVTRYWRRMVGVDLDSHSGLIDIEVRAFTPADAQLVAGTILAEAGKLITALSEQARRDAVRLAEQELTTAETRLRQLRRELAAFRTQNRIADPEADLNGRMGLLTALQSQLAQAIVERDTTLTYAGEEDQRVVRANRRIGAITARIEEERQSLGAGGAGGTAPMDVLGSYEELQVDLEFASSAYTQALAALGVARAEAQRQSRYLVAHIAPTRAESALYPRRLLLLALAAVSAALGWGVLTVLYFNLRDAR